MKRESKNIGFGPLLSQMLAATASEVPGHLNHKEEVLFAVFLSANSFSSFDELISDIDLFLKEELDLNSITRENVSDINFSSLATKFGNRYGLSNLLPEVGDNADDLKELGWKSTRTIFIKVLQPQLRRLAFEDAQHLVLVLEDFICSYSIIQGESPGFVLNQLKFWEAFKDYKFTLELDTQKTKKRGILPPTKEFIQWNGMRYSVEEAGEDLQSSLGLIVDKNQWIQFFQDHTTRIEVVHGKQRSLIAVLHQMEYKDLFGKNRKKGCWKIWQEILIDKDGELFSRELRKISSDINIGASERDKICCQFGLDTIQEMMKKERL